MEINIGDIVLEDEIIIDDFKLDTQKIKVKGTLEITENGQYDVSDKASVDVDVQPNVAPKTITENGIYNANDDNLDGYNEVNVEVIANLDEFINTNNVTPGGSVYASSIGHWIYLIKKLPKLIIKCPPNTSYFFHYYGGTSLDLSGFDTSEVTSLQNMFSYSTKLETINLSSIDTTKVEIMSYMFSGCNNLKELDLSNFNTDNLIYMSDMFNNCSNLKHLDLSNFNTSKVTSFTNLFKGCKSLETLNVKNLNTDNVVIMNLAFYGCESLKHLDLSGWNTQNVTNMKQLFDGCKKLELLDIRNFDFTNVTTYSSMFGMSGFSNFPTNCLIIVKDETAKTWITSKFTNLTNVKTVAEYEAI